MTASVKLDVEALKREMAIRGWSNSDLAAAAGLSLDTIKAGLYRRRNGNLGSFGPESAERIAAAFNANPPDPILERLVP